MEEWRQLSEGTTPPAIVATMFPQYNRYRDVFPRESHRVVLPYDAYINADLVKPLNVIATQAPLEETLYDFWLMIMEYKVPMILSFLTNQELSQPVKSCRYFPKVNETWTLLPTTQYDTTIGSLQLHGGESVAERPSLTRRVLVVENQAGVRHRVDHYHYSGWIDQRVPNLETEIETLCHLFTLTLTPQPNPLVVHCSAGVGRTGTFLLALDCLRSNENVSLERLATLRQYRHSCIQTQSQYQWVKDFVRLYKSQ
jgi:protein tyrosine phosphatase